MADVDVRGGGPQVTWDELSGKKVVVHVPRGSLAANAAPNFLRVADAMVAALEEFLKPTQSTAGPIDVYLVDPIAEVPGALTGGDVDAAGDGHAGREVGERGILHPVRAEEGPGSIARPLTEMLVTRWYGPDAAKADVFVAGLAAMAAYGAGAGPSVEEASAWVRNEIESGGMVSVIGGEQAPAGAGGMAATAPALSFVGFLMESSDPGSVGRLFETYRPDRRDEAVIAIFHQPLAALEETWFASLFGGEGTSMTESLKFLAPLLKPHLPQYLEAIAYMVVAVIFTITVPLVSGCLVDGLTTAGVPGAPEPGGFCGIVGSIDRGRVVIIVLALLAAYVIEALLSIRRAYVEAEIFNGVGLSLRERMFTHLQRLPHKFYAQARVGDITTRLSEDLEELQAAMAQVFGGGVFMAMTSGLAALTTLAKSPVVGVLVLALIPVFILANKFLGARIAMRSLEVQELSGDAASVLQENLSAHAVVKAFNLEERSIATYRARVKGVLRAGLRLTVVGQLYEGTINFATTSAQLIILGVGSILIIGGTINDPGTLVTLLLLLPSIMVPISSLANIGQTAQMAAGSIQRTREILNEPIDIAEKPDAIELPPLSQEIKFENVSFGYEADRPILRDLNLTIPKGRSVAIVGPSGSGKSTVVNLLLRFWDPDEGRVSIDGHDLRDVTLASLRGQIGIVFQETFIFNSTVRDNIGIGRPEATDEEIVAAAKAAQLESFVESQPAGYDTVMGERGVRMSGGQRQRLAIARALLRDPAILVLDEATSALDAGTEAEILETLASVVRTRTTIAITHRLAMAASADVILVLEQGQLVEQGSHEELVTAGGLYQRLYEEQTSHVAPGGRPRVGLEGARLRVIPLFADLDPDALGSLAERLLPEKFAPGDEIVRQGDPGDKLYMINRGEAEVLVTDGRAERRVNTLKEGDYFGEYALLTGEDRTATVRASTPMEVYGLAQQDFADLVENEPVLQQKLSAFVAERSAAYAAAAEAAGIAAEAGGGAEPA